jgi:hypothetical protein
VYRLLFWPSRSKPGPVALRVAPDANGATLQWVHLERAPTSEFEQPENAPNTAQPAIPMQCGVAELPWVQWEEFRSCVDQPWFWDASPGEPSLGATDVNVWILEGLKDGRYHFIAREAPHRSTAQPGLRPVFECGRLLERLVPN